MSNTTIVKRPNLTPDIWQMVQAMAPAMHGSRLFEVSNPEQAIAIMVKGFELGLPLTASFNFIHVIRGKPALAPVGALALIQGSPLLDSLKIEDLKDDKGQPNACRVYMKRTNGFEYTVEFSMEDAKRAGLVKPDSGWSKYPANMLRWRAIGFCADIVFPDVIGGLKRADEYGADLTPDGDVIEGEWRMVPVENKSDMVLVTLDELIATYGPEAILQANGGAIPAMIDDVQRIAEVLANDS